MDVNGTPECRSFRRTSRWDSSTVAVTIRTEPSTDPTHGPANATDASALRVRVAVFSTGDRTVRRPADIVRWIPPRNARPRARLIRAFGSPRLPYVRTR